MAKISALTTLANTATAAGDMVPVVDASANQTKKMLIEKAVEGFLRASVAGTDVLAYNGTLLTITAANVGVTGTLAITSASANALIAGRQGTTNPGFQVDASVATNVTGLKITPRAAAAGVDLAVISSGANESLVIDAKGTGTITLNGTGTGNILTPRAILSSGATAGLGYTTGAGGTVTQITSRTTGVTINKVTGAITLVSAAGSATPASFTVTNSAVGITDKVTVNQKSGTDLYNIHVTNIAAGSFRITSYTTGGTTTESPVFSFTVHKGVEA